MVAARKSGILITGSTGQVGGALADVFAGRSAEFGPIHTPARSQLDLSNPASIQAAVRTLRPRWILNSAAYTAVDQAESAPEAAFAINSDAVRILGEEACAAGSVVVHFSTDYVFSGDGAAPRREEDLPAPANVYGASKLAGELALAETGAAHLILRTSWVYGATGKNFLKTVLRCASTLPQMRIVNDQHGAPTWCRDLARATLAAVQSCEASAVQGALVGAAARVGGVYHLTSAGETTWFHFAEEALRLARVASPDTHFAPLIPISTRDYPVAARRPINSRLNGHKFARVFGFAMPDWQTSLAAVMNELQPEVCNSL